MKDLISNDKATIAALAERLKRAQSDPGLRGDLAALAGDTTDDLGPIQ